MKSFSKDSELNKLPSPKYHSIFLILSSLAVTSCTTVELPRAHPPAVIKQHPTRQDTTKQRPVTVTRPQSIPEVRQPAGSSIPRPEKPKPPTVVVKAYEPEQGDNPYNHIPKRASTTSRTVTTGQTPGYQSTGQETSTSPAVKSLLIQAKAAMLIKRNAAAIEKLERALRIEPRNPEIWYQLAKAHYNQKDDGEAISMAKKSNLYVDEGSTLEKQNWQLIKAASKRSENITSLKAAIRYERAHP